MRMDERPKKYDTGSAGLRDGSKNAVERCLKANHLALHDFVEGKRGEINFTTDWPSRRDGRLSDSKMKKREGEDRVRCALDFSSPFRKADSDRS